MLPRGPTSMTSRSRQLGWRLPQSGLRLPEQVGMASGPNEQHFRGADGVDQQPVGIDVALPRSLPFTRQSVWLVRDGQHARLRQHLNGGDQVVNIFPAAFLPFDVLPELLPLRDPSHRARSKRAHFIRPLANGVETLDVLARACLSEGTLCLRIGQAHGKRKTACEFDLHQKQRNGLARGQADLLEHGLSVALEFRLDPRPYGLGLSHAANVAPSSYRYKPAADRPEPRFSSSNRRMARRAMRRARHPHLRVCACRLDYFVYTLYN